MSHVQHCLITSKGDYNQRFVFLGEFLALGNKTNQMQLIQKIFVKKCAKVARFPRMN
jgi:hypothetical protein